VLVDRRTYDESAVQKRKAPPVFAPRGFLLYYVLAFGAKNTGRHARSAYHTVGRSCAQCIPHFAQPVKVHENVKAYPGTHTTSRLPQIADVLCRLQRTHAPACCNSASLRAPSLTCPCAPRSAFSNSVRSLKL